MVTTEPRKPFVVSVEREQLRKALLAAGPGETVPFQLLSEAIGRDVLTCRWLLASARRAARDEDEVVFAAVSGVGLRRLPNTEIPSRGSAALGKARRAVVRGAKDVKCADYNTLPADQQAKFNTTLSLSGAIMLMTKPSRMKKLEGSAAQRFSPNETLRLFLPGKKK